MINYDRNSMMLNINNKRIEFTATEFKIFDLLIKKHPLYATYEEISKKLYGTNFCDYYIKNNIDVHISRLRKKLKRVFVITKKKELGISINFDRAYLKRYG